MLFLEQTQGFGSTDGHGSIGGSQPPSLYELLMQERMASGFKPALEYLVQTICDAYPHVSATLPVRHFEESYALLMAVMERYFLNRYDSLAGEKFYGIKRVMYHPAAAVDSTLPSTSSKIAATASTSALTDGTRRRSLLLAVLVPYLKAKLDNYHRKVATEVGSTSRPAASQPEQLTEDYSTSPSAVVAARRRWRVFWRRFQQLGVLAKLKRGFVKAYPFAHLTYEASFFLYQWLYLFGDTPYFSPFLRRLGVVLVRVTPTDESAIVQKQNDYRAKLIESLSGSSAVQRVRRGVLRTAWAVYDHSYVLLMLGIASYKFLEWMYSDEGSAAIKIRSTGVDAPIPPPPVPPLFAGNAAITLSTLDASTCPLCQKRRVNPAASVSGYVFCYPCLYRHIDDHGKCPVTHIPCDVASIIKIYDDATA